MGEKLQTETIAAVATPPGTGGIGIVRVSGPRSLELLGKSWKGKTAPLSFKPRRLYYGKLGPGDHAIDTVIACWMKAPHSYTGEDVVEVHCHGGSAVVRSILDQFLGIGARAAEPGEFTKRAFLNGRLDLTQAEAVAGLIESQSVAAARIFQNQLDGKLSQVIDGLRRGLKEALVQIESSIDFSEEAGESESQHILKEVEKAKDELQKLSDTYEESRKFREGVRVGLVGRPNVGKSSLLNQLLMEDRAIVHHSPGTTRDVIEETILLNGLPVKFMDTAGIHEPTGDVEAMGIERTQDRIRKADFILFLIDQSEAWTEADQRVWELIRGQNGFILLNKSDLPSQIVETDLPQTWQRLRISAKTGHGVKLLKQVFVQKILKEGSPSDTEVWLTSARQKQGVDRALKNLSAAEGNLKSASYELASVDLKGSLTALGEIIGEVTSEEILTDIFSKFCIGK